MTSRMRQLQAVGSTLRSAPAPPAASHEPVTADISPGTVGDAQRDPFEQRLTGVPVVLLKREVKVLESRHVNAAVRARVPAGTKIVVLGQVSGWTNLETESGVSGWVQLDDDMF